MTIKKYSITQIRNKLKDFVPSEIPMTGCDVDEFIKQIIAEIEGKEYKKHRGHVCGN